MTKSLIITIALVAVTTFANAFSVRYYNKDSKTYKWDIKINGSTRTIEFRSSTTSTASASMSTDEIEIKTDCGWIKVKDDANITIKDGCIKIN